MRPNTRLAHHIHEYIKWNAWFCLIKHIIITDRRVKNVEENALKVLKIIHNFMESTQWVLHKHFGVT